MSEQRRQQAEQLLEEAEELQSEIVQQMEAALTPTEWRRLKLDWENCLKSIEPLRIELGLPLLPRTEPPDYYAAKRKHLYKKFSDHSGFMRDRLESFVGRASELADIQQQITEKLTTGGYITITGQAGQGKSSVIAKLVQQHIQQANDDDSKIAYHFIPFNPGPGHQVNLLRNLMARLILKYDLSDIYVASESRPTLRDFFPRLLSELVAKGGQEVIFIDGLDQLEEEQSGTRDLSFLPDKSHLPENVVFVLGTRFNDTLKPLELLLLQQVSINIPQQKVILRLV